MQLLRSPRALEAGGVAVVLGVLAAGLLHLGRGITWFYDEWGWVQRAAPAGEPGLSGLLEPGNGHLSLVLFGTYRALLHTTGLEHYLPLRLLVLALHLLTALGLYAYARRRVPLALAAGAALLVALLGSGWQMVFWGAGMTFVLPVGAGVWVLWLLDGDRPSRAWAASAVSALAVGMSALGVPVAVAALLDAMRPRPHRRQRLLALSVPLALFALWYVRHGGQGGVAAPETTRLQQLEYAVTSGAAAVAGLLRGTPAQGLLGLLLVLALVATALWRGPERGRLLVVCVLPASFWALTALSRAGLGENDASRYLYAGGVWLLLVLVEAAPRVVDLRIPALQGALLVALVVVLVPQVDLLRRGASSLRSDSAETVSTLAVMHLYRDRVAPDFAPDLRVMPNVRAAPYFSAVDAFGDPSAPASSLPSQPPHARAAADATLVRAAGLAALPAGAGTGCTPSADEVALPSGTVRVQADVPAAVSVRRFADAPGKQTTLPVEAGTSTIELPADALSSEVPWILRGAGEGVRLCA